MTNRAVGIIGSAVCSVSVLCFAVSMIVGIFVNTLFLSCFASMFIALGFMLFMCAVSGSNKDNEKRACGNVSLVCAAIYVTLIFLVYFAECTTVNLSPQLDEKILSIIDYGHTGSLFFNYDLLGYGFMALSTFFAGFLVNKTEKHGKTLSLMLKMKGIYMLAKRIIPCLDVRDGKVVKGINFVGIKEVGDPVECAEEYNAQGADEICFLDITATHEGRGTMVDVVRRTAQRVFVPLTVGGGISSVDDFRELLRSGADKVSVNSAAVRNPQLIHDAAEIFGSQCVVVAIDAKKKGDSWTVVVNGGRIDMNIDAIEWAKKAEELGAGEILLTSMDTDGMKTGFDIELLNAVCDVVKIPVIASGGCGTLEHFSEVFQKTKASAALAASLFHYKELTVSQVKEHLEENNIPVRRVD